MAQSMQTQNFMTYQTDQYYQKQQIKKTTTKLPPVINHWAENQIKSVFEILIIFDDNIKIILLIFS